MITILRSSDRGHRDHGWLDTYHSFSFGDHFDPERMAFGPLRVLNQDRVAGGAGFPPHGHADMEIVSYVLEGALEHEDSMGNGSRMRPGEVQLMSAGSGVQHSEFNASRTDGLHFLQMWVVPSERGLAPRYFQETFSEEERSGTLRLVVSPDGEDGSLLIRQDARLRVGILSPGDAVPLVVDEGRGVYLHVATGSMKLDGRVLEAGDGAEIVGPTSLQLTGAQRSEVVAWDVPLDPSIAR